MSAPNLVKCSKCGELMMPHVYAKLVAHTINVRLFPLTNRELNEEDVKYDFTSFFYCYAYDKKMSDGHFLVDFYNNIN